MLSQYACFCEGILAYIQLLGADIQRKLILHLKFC